MPKPRTLLALAWLAASPAASAASDPLTLDEALALAARANLDLRLAENDRSGAQVDAYGSYAGVLPRLDLQAQFGNQYSSYGQELTIVPVQLSPLSYQKLVVPTPAADFETYTFGLQLNLPLFDGFTSWARISQSEALSRAAARQYDEAALATAASVIARFYEVVRAERSLGVLEGAARRSEDLVRRTDELYQAGRASRADTYAARVTLGNDRIAAEQQSARVVAARVDLSQSLGREADPELRVVAPRTLEAPAFLDPPPLRELLDLARSRRPVLAADDERVRAAGEDVRAAQGGYWPAVSAQASYLRQSSWLYGTYGAYGDPTQQYVATVGVTVNWNLFEGRATSAAVQRANVGLARARLAAEQALLDLTGEVARARSSYVTLVRSSAIAEENLRSAGESLRLARVRFEAGAAPQLEIADALLKLTQAELALLGTRVDALVAGANLNRAVGGALWAKGTPP